MNHAIETLNWSLKCAKDNLIKINRRITIDTNDWVETQKKIIDIENVINKLSQSKTTKKEVKNE